MTRILGLSCAGLLLIVGFIGRAHAQEAIWRPVARACAERIDQAQRCGSCSDMWPAWSECMIKQVYPTVPRATIQRCEDYIWNSRWQAQTCGGCGDPVADMVVCIGGKR